MEAAVWACVIPVKARQGKEKMVTEEGDRGSKGSSQEGQNGGKAEGGM